MDGPKPNPLSRTERKLTRDLRTLARFIQVYCDGRHSDRDQAEVSLKTHSVKTIARRSIRLCDECRNLLAHSFVKRAVCPHDPKPMCRHCQSHCYAPTYREQIREVMRYAGPRLVLRGRLDYLWHLLF